MEAVVEPPFGAGPGVKAGLAVAMREIVCGEPGASSVMVKFAVLWAETTGLKTSEIVQLAEGATGAWQLLVKLKSKGLGPPRETEEICSGPVPELVIVRIWAKPDVP